MSNDKMQTHKFLSALQHRLSHELPSPSAMREAIQKMIAEPKNENNKHLRPREAAFLNGFAVPKIFEHMQTLPGIGEKEAKQALLSEYYGSMRKYHQQSPRRRLDHPFEKSRRVPAEILNRWFGKEPNNTGGFRKPFHQPCPDLAWGNPFPHKVVFETKYFWDGKGPETQLVDGIYETFYYLAMPRLSAAPSHPAWDYDFGCFLAFDASPERSLERAWEGIEEEVKSQFWSRGNLFVMIIRPTETAILRPK